MSGEIVSTNGHIVACLESRLASASANHIVEESRNVIEYFVEAGPTEGKKVHVAGYDWVVLGRNTSDERMAEQPIRCPSHGDHKVQHNLCIQQEQARSCQFPFWRGNGDDTVIQKLLHCACIGYEDRDRTKPDEFGRVDYNSFRSIIFSCKVKPEAEVTHSFLLSPVIPHEGDELGKRIEQTLLLIKFLDRAGLDKIRVCVLKGARASWREQSGSADIITRHAEILKSNVLERLKKDETLAKKVEFVPNSDCAEDKDIGFEIERAILRADLIVAFDGSTGNLMARMLAFSSNTTELYAIPWFIRYRPWPVGEGGFLGYSWKHDPEAPLKRAIMWKVLEGHTNV